MAQPRTPTTPAPTDLSKEPHNVSLKVLRLSRPTLASQYPLANPTNALSSAISPTASVAFPSSSKNSNSFVISPLLTLPLAFGSAYVGETFSCTLSANNELPQASANPPTTNHDPLLAPSRPAATSGVRKLSNVRIEAEMKTPTMTVPLDVSIAALQSAGVDSPQEDGETPAAEQSIIPQGNDLAPAASLQGIISYHLREEGSHVLSVTVSYFETMATSGRSRSFRKLYQFVARPCLVVRTKISAFGLPGKDRGRWALEAQLENVGEDAIVLTSVGLATKEWCNYRSLNWDAVGTNSEVGVENPILGAGDVQQVCFLVEQKDGEDGEKTETDVAGRLVVGMLTINWRGAMGNMGSLSTGWLGVKP